MNEEMKKLNIYERINYVMSRVSYVKKGSVVGTGQNTYTAVGHDDVTRLLNEHIQTAGIVVTPSIVEVKTNTIQYTQKNKYGEKEVFRCEVQMWVEVKFTNMNAPGENFTVTGFAIGLDNQDKAPGKALSMAVKNAYLKVFMLESGDNEEARIDDKALENLKKIDYKQQIEQIKTITELCANATIGFTPEQKGEFMKTKLKVSKFTDLNRMDNEFLANVITNIPTGG